MPGRPTRSSVERRQTKECARHVPVKLIPRSVQNVEMCRTVLCVIFNIVLVIIDKHRSRRARNAVT